MGSTPFHDIVCGDRDLHDAYAEAVRDARASDGSDPYNGTISTTAGVQLHPEFGNTLLSEAVARQMTHSRLDHLHKWSNAEAIAVAADADVVSRQFTVQVALEGNQHAYPPALWAAVIEAARTKLRTGEHVASFEAGEWNTRTRTQVNVAEGVSELLYFVTPVDPRWPSRSVAPWSRRNPHIDPAGYKSKAAARAAATAAAKAATEPCMFAVTARRLVAGDENLLTVSSEVVKATAKIAVTVHKVKPKAKQAGWLFYGLAAC